MNDLDKKNPYMQKNKDDAKFEWVKFSCSIAASSNNRAGVELFGGKTDVIKTKDTENNDIEIDIGDKDDPEIKKTVANYRKHIFSFVPKDDGSDETERAEFIYDYDAVQYLIKNVKYLKNQRVCITGNISKNVYNGKVTDRFQIQNIYTVDDDVNDSLRVSDVFFWNKESDIDTDDFKENKRINIDGYVSSFIDKKTLGEEKGANKYVPQSITLDCSKLDFENENHMKILDFYLMMLGLKRNDKGKIVSSLKNKNYYKQQIDFEYYNGADEIEWNESMLTDVQRTQCELFGKKPEDFKPVGRINGDWVTLYKVVGFPSRAESEYAEGIVDTDLSPDDFEEDILVIPEKEDKTIEEVIEEKKNEKTSEKDMENLFR